ncbi:MAG: NAD(P)-dependent oxidoreductase [Methylomonas sp.]|jgi:nucleoside-diphosphate-sugar epimerase|uniref:NAD-dependent epimerase/dehydratase family protein n=1 Tax=Methylomonas sp. TaxID=418 RepID=UPI0025E94AD9|nr:NAD(P)-dependent oxidoreductase [Methylomonas sp.]MCK9607892.1 NAD(P)-dependent oxidoreductase [Methylomonas sp.]
MNSVILVGATSMLGLEVARQLLSEGTEVIGAGRQIDSNIRVNLGSDQEPVFQKPYKADVVIHCASAFGVDSPEGLRENLRVNVGGCFQVLEIAREAEAKKIVYAGTGFSDPSFNLDPMGVYGFSKAEAERILDWGITRAGGTFCSLRLPQLWDTDGMCCVHQPWFGRIVAYASRGLSLKMPTSNGVRNFMHVSDAVRLLILASQTDLTGVHTVAHPIDVDLVELARSAYQVFGKGGSVVIDQNKAPFRKVAFPKEDGVYARLGFEPALTTLQGLERIREAGTSDRFGPMDVQ